MLSQLDPFPPLLDFESCAERSEDKSDYCVAQLLQPKLPKETANSYSLDLRAVDLSKS